jgi:methylated-DNA-protein-cysteine methyltransferase-like protein
MRPVTSAGTRARIYAVVRRIPRGRVATYGQVAELAGLPGHARQVGYALHALPAGTRVPWHRVINAAGAVSLRAAAGDEVTQRQLLESEGIVFDARGRVPLARVRWRAAASLPARRRRLSGVGLEDDTGLLGA